MTLTDEAVLLKDRDVTELSEFRQDKFIVGLWSENDFVLLDRGANSDSELIK